MAEYNHGAQAHAAEVLAKSAFMTPARLAANRLNAKKGGRPPGRDPRLTTAFIRYAQSRGTEAIDLAMQMARDTNLNADDRLECIRFVVDRGMGKELAEGGGVPGVSVQVITGVRGG